jgi:SAM-dependent methyltransferase
LSNNDSPVVSPYSGGYGLRFPESQIISSIYQFLEFSSRDSETRIRILDVGCGLGNHALLLETVDADYVGIDSDPIAIQRAKQIFAHKPYAKRINFESIGIYDYSLGSQYPNSFSLIIDRACLQHNSASDLISEQGLLAKLALGLENERGILVSYWASKYNDKVSMMQRFPDFTGFEEIAQESRQFLQILSNKRIVQDELEFSNMTPPRFNNKFLRRLEKGMMAELFFDSLSDF